MFDRPTNCLLPLSLTLLLSVASVWAPFECSVAWAQHPAEIGWHAFNEGDTYLAEQKLDLAETQFKEALRLLPNDLKYADARAKCLLKLANTLTLSNKTAEAQTDYEKLLSLEEQTHGSNSASLVPALLALGSIQESEGNHSVAMTYYQRALHINERNVGPYSPAVADNLGRMARVSWKQGNRTESAKHYKRSLAILLRQPGLSSSNQLQGVLTNYSDLLKGLDNSNHDLIKDFQTEILQEDKASRTARSGDTALPVSTISGARDKSGSAAKQKTADKGAKPYQSSASGEPLSLPRIQPPADEQQTSRISGGNPAAATESSSSWQQTAGSDSAIASVLGIPGAGAQGLSATGTAANNGVSSNPAESAWQKQSHVQLNVIKEGETNEDPLVTMRGFAKPSSDATLSPAYRTLDRSLIMQNRYGQGVENYERMIATDVNALGPNHPTVANDLTGLAQICLAQQKYGRAQELLSRAVPIYEKAYGLNNVLTLNAIASLASAEFQLGHVDHALELYRKALSSGQIVLGPNSLETARILNEMAHIYYYQGKLQEARTFYEWAVASTQGAVGDHDSLLAACLKDYAQVLRSLGMNSEASLAELRADKIIAADGSHSVTN